MIPVVRLLATVTSFILLLVNLLELNLKITEEELLRNWSQSNADTPPPRDFGSAALCPLVNAEEEQPEEKKISEPKSKAQRWFASRLVDDEEVIALHLSGRTVLQIANALEISRKKVYTVLERHNYSDTRKSGNGRFHVVSFVGRQLDPESVTLCPETSTVRYEGKSADLTAYEYNVVNMLWQVRDTYCSMEILLRLIGPVTSKDFLKKASHLRSQFVVLRPKLQDIGLMVYVRKGHGYRLGRYIES